MNNAEIGPGPLTRAKGARRVTLAPMLLNKASFDRHNNAFQLFRRPTLFTLIRPTLGAEQLDDAYIVRVDRLSS